MPCSWLHERVGIVATVDPQTLANSALLSDAVDMSKFKQVTFILLTGNMANETLDFRVDESATSGGTYAALKTMTQQAADANNNDNNQYIITVKSEELSAGKQFLKGRAVTGGATGGPACIIALGEPLYAPATDDDLASVAVITT